MNKSIPSTNSVDFINLHPLNPLISRCEIKVLYAGKNRNGSFISKEVANNMANSLPGTPIIGEYFYEADDFGDHGQEEMVIGENGIRFIKETVPYGFIPTDAKVWWKNFIDKDDVEREYLVTEGYLWTGRYPETERIIKEGNHQSMELDRDSLVGQWSKIDNEDGEYFIISDATFTGLCILGQDVEPCFEGANITKNSNLVYSLNKDDFKDKMLDFMSDLKFTLSNFNYEGGERMENLENPIVETEETIETPVVETEIPVVEHSVEDEEFAKKKKEDEEEDDKEDSKGDSDDEDTEDDDDEEDKKKKKKMFSVEEEEEFAKKKEDEEEEEEDKKKKKCGYSLEEVVEYQELLAKFNALEENYNTIVSELEGIKPEFNKLKELQIEAENNAKEEMINSFYMLSDQDKAPIRENKNNFTLEEIEAKLSVICVRNKVNFNLDDSSKNESNTETPITTFNVGEVQDTTPAWLRVVDQIANKK